MSTPIIFPPKKEVALALLKQASLFIHLDPRPQEVWVPVNFKHQSHLVLQVGLNMAVPIPDLQVDDEGICGTLRFDQTPFFCKIPWSSIYALIGEEGAQAMVWPDDIPPELNEAMGEATLEENKPKTKKEKPKSRLKIVKTESGSTSRTSSSKNAKQKGDVKKEKSPNKETKTKGKGKRPTYLRIVK